MSLYLQREAVARGCGNRGNRDDGAIEKTERSDIVQILEITRPDGDPFMSLHLFLSAFAINGAAVLADGPCRR